MARNFVDQMQFDHDLNVSLFETTIRILGGLLGAYELSQDSMLLHKAKDMADKLMWAFNTSSSAIPFPSINLRTHKGWPTWGQPVTTLAEIGTLQLEFNALSRYLKDTRYSQYGMYIMDLLDNMDPVAGLYPLLYNLSSGHTTDFYGHIITLGSNADSFYEYILKQWLQTGSKDDRLRTLYDEAVQGNKRLRSVTISKKFLLEINVSSVAHAMRSRYVAIPIIVISCTLTISSHFVKSCL
jgi:mannosyl-oligosaccharide alpha-1,2-mannosidase